MQQISVQLNSDTGEPRCDTDHDMRVSRKSDISIKTQG